MEDYNAQVPTAANVPAVRFQSNAQFRNRNMVHLNDSAFAHFQRKSWMRSKSDSRSNREALATLLSMHSDNSDECTEKLLSENIYYSDLASLTNADLELMGFKQPKEREELLNLFAELPNQLPTYENICSMPSAETFNREILNNATKHLEHLRSALMAANYKLKIMPPEDTVVGEKNFASRFVLEALTELKNATNEINKELADLEELIVGDHIKPSARKKRSNLKPSGKAARNFWLVCCTMAAVSALAALWYLKGNKSI